MPSENKIKKNTTTKTKNKKRNKQNQIKKKKRRVLTFRTSTLACPPPKSLFRFT